MTGFFRWGARYGLVVLITLYVLAGLLFVGYARLNLDEGMHIAAARLAVLEGAFPYRDFPFSQGPVAPYAYGAAIGPFGPSIPAGRLVSFLASLLTVGGGAWLARRAAGRGAAALVLGLTLLSLPLLWNYTTIRTQPLATPLVLLSVVALCREPRGALAWSASPVLLVWATGLRLTNGVALLAVLLLVAFQLRHSLGLLVRTAGIVAIHGMLALGVAFVVAPGRMLFQVLFAQSTREQRLELIEATSLWDGLRLKFGFFLTPDTGFFPISLLGFAVAIYLIAGWNRGWRPQLAPPLRDPRSLQLVLLSLAALVYLPHLGLEHGFASYFVTSAALLVPAISIGAWAWSAAPGKMGILARWLLAAILVLAAVTTGAYQDRWLALRDPSLPRLREIATELRRLAPDDCTVLTFHTYVPAQAGCRVFPGFEYSLFSYFPRLPTDEAARQGVLNYELLKRRLRELEPEFALFSPQDLPVFTAGQEIGAPRRLRRLSWQRRWEERVFHVFPSMRDRYVFHRRFAMSVGPRVYSGSGQVALLLFVRSDLVP